MANPWGLNELPDLPKIHEAFAVIMRSVEADITDEDRRRRSAAFNVLRMAVEDVEAASTKESAA